MTDRGPDPGRRRTHLRHWSLVALAAVVLWSSVAPAGAAATLDGGQTPLANGQSAVDAGPLAQQDGGDDPLTVCDRNVVGFTDAFNSGSEQVPAFVRARISDSDVHLAVEGDGGGDFTLVADDDSQITASSAGEPASPSVRVITDCETFRNITDAADPGAQFRTAYANDRIRFVGVGAANWLFFTTLETVTDPISLGVVLFLFLVLLVVAYVVVRRATSVVRGGRVDNRGGSGGAGGGGGQG